jgi:GT2 family glycosyltransferase
MSNSEKTSIIIVNYRSADYLEKCLESVYEKSQSAFFEVILVNNDSKENLKLIKEKFPAVQVIERDKNCGFGAAINIGAKKASGQHLFFINPDAELLNDAILIALAEFKKTPVVAVIGAKIVDQKGQSQSWLGGRDISLTELILNNLGFYRGGKLWKQSEKTNTDWVSGGAMFVKKDVFEQIGGFDENFFMYFEDIDLCRRIRKAGSKIIYLPKIKVMHYSGKSFTDKKEQKNIYFKSQDYFFKKNFGTGRALLVRFLRKLFG